MNDFLFFIKTRVLRSCPSNQLRVLSFGLTFLLASVLALATPQVSETASGDLEGVRAESSDGMAPPAAPVTVDGRVLFTVRGISAYPAAVRAEVISNRIRALAASDKFNPGQLTVVDSEDYTSIMAGEQLVAGVHDLDAELEGVGRQLLARILKEKITLSIGSYRQERLPRTLLVRSAYAAGATVLVVLLIFLTLRLLRRSRKWLENRYRARLQDVKVQSFQVVQAERLWGAIIGFLMGVRTLIIVVLVIAYAEYVLGLYPWTRSFARVGLTLLLTPLKSIGAGLLEAVPGLLFIAVLVLLLRYLLKLLRILFAGIETGTLRFSGFDPEWSWPTYKILRLMLAILGVVVAYPYIPGAGTEAFKGISIFLGVVFSLGSSSAISNIIAGYTMTYRRAFKVGDRVKIGEVVGEVMEIRLQVTHLRSLKNEEVIVPNSSILNSHVINYSSLARKGGLILHTSVGIGYETPWRQVEAMLHIAAERTPGLLREPGPFVLQKLLGDFCVVYELNVFTDRPEDGPRLYTALHQNILDVFNEHEIQIMTPAYETDTPEPKIVPKDKWFEPPAAPPDESAPPGSRTGP